MTTTPPISLSSFQHGYPEEPIVKFFDATCVVQADLSRNLQSLLDKGYMHFEIDEDILLDGTPVYAFYRVPPLDVRLSRHVKAKFLDPYNARRQRCLALLNR